MTEEQFQRAREDVDFRRQYVCGFDLGSYNKLIARLIYAPDEAEKSTVMCTAPHPLAQFGIRRTKSIVAICPRVFEIGLVQTEQEFISALLDHEAFHARQFYYRPRTYVPSWFDYRMDDLLRVESGVDKEEVSAVNAKIRVAHIEVEAYANQLYAIDKGARKVSKKFRDQMARTLQFYSQLAQCRPLITRPFQYVRMKEVKRAKEQIERLIKEHNDMSDLL